LIVQEFKKRSATREDRVLSNYMKYIGA